MTPPELANWLEREGANCQRHIDAGALIRAQQAAIERKDKAIKEALDELNEFVKAPYLDYCLVFGPIHELQKALK
jgi:hypothetical protein